MITQLQEQLEAQSYQIQQLREAIESYEKVELAMHPRILESVNEADLLNNSYQTLKQHGSSSNTFKNISSIVNLPIQTSQQAKPRNEAKNAGR